ncbi:MAG: 1-deoxy-D-xylulose-5-phosphate reductoisomerase [Bacteroidales bacterium]|nr:MAG: 1-deoxy-D-xylulose-5-phosphate reductoisomerase [Bacteroidales bacterium]
MKRIAIIGSTGSIGSQALQVIEEHEDEFGLEVLTANRNADLLIRQALRHVPKAVVIGNQSEYNRVRDALAGLPVKVYAGEDALNQVVEMDTIDIVLTALVGFCGLQPTVNAIKSGKDIALANKETLVVAGEYITRLAEENNTMILPVDSEHSAIFQCLVGENTGSLEKIYLTASGGPFRNLSMADLENVTREEALNHPNWDMGEKITIDSASLMNKGLEAIEARWLFNLRPEQIEVVVHPQSIIHSFVQFVDGSMKAQMGLPDMKLPILYALAFPNRLKSSFTRFNFTDYPSLTFEKADTKKFRNLALSFEAMKKGGNMPCVLNAANEVAVEAFLSDRIRFLAMPEIIEETMNKCMFIGNPGLEDYKNTDQESRKIAESLIK